jgi:acetyl-CoA carboxylase biotin carboxyl carrier protein
VGEVQAEMVASVLRVEVKKGARILEGDTLVVLESMKMEIPVFAPADGVVVEIRVQEGQTVHEGDVIAVLE